GLDEREEVERIRLALGREELERVDEVEAEGLVEREVGLEVLVKEHALPPLRVDRHLDDVRLKERPEHRQRRAPEAPLVDRPLVRALDEPADREAPPALAREQV